MSADSYTVPASRMSYGLFGEKKGDIAEAYACMRLSGMERKPGVAIPAVPVFNHDGKLWTSGGGGGNWSHIACDCHELIPEQLYTGPDSAPYSYEGMTVSYKAQRFRLGPKTKFVGVRTVAEFRMLLRGMYKEGGCFTGGHTYHSMLRSLEEKQVWNGEKQAWAPNAGPHLEAIRLELAETRDWTKWGKEEIGEDEAYEKWLKETTGEQPEPRAAQMELAL